jgi:GTP-binding protein
MKAEAFENTKPPGERAPRLAVVAIVGRPNAGKSTFFNRLIRAPRAIVDSQPGVTRDRNIAAARWKGRPFLLIDTGGFEEGDESTLAAAVRAQRGQAVREADVVIALLDGRAGRNPADRDLVDHLRQSRKPVLYAINKLDTPAHDDEAAEFFALGLPEVFPVSAAHGRGIAELMDRLITHLPDEPAAEAGVHAPVTLAIVGRPNVGKSSLLNRIVGHERAIVDAAPGTTRDALDTPFRCGTQDYVLIDTAGIRRRPRLQGQLERASVQRAQRALARAEIALLVIDATEGMTDQDARLANDAWERGRALLFVVNKWDAVPRAQRDRRRFLRTLRERYATFADVPAVCLSALTGAGVAELFPALEELVAAHRRSVRTVHLNDVLAAATRAQAPPAVRGKPPRFYYATQTATAPPTFTIFASHPELVPAVYERYLANTLRSAFGLQGTPVRLRFRRRPQRP